MTWPTGRAATAAGNGHVAAQANPPNSFPVPAGRGRWRLTLHQRDFTTTGLPVSTTIMAELVDARSRRLEQAWNTPARLTFSLDGRSPAAALISELASDVLAWRWDDRTGQDRLLFRGVVAQTEDQLSEQAYTLTVTCHDYLAVLARRLVTSTWAATATDQDNLVAGLLARASGSAASSSGTSFAPGSNLPLIAVRVDPAGNNRGLSGAARDRTYYPSQNIGQALDDLAKVQGGFDYDVQPLSSGGIDPLRIFYPYQGITRTDPALVYGSTVAAVTRTVNSGDYANYTRALGNNGSSDPTAAQLYGEAWNADANNVTVTPVGLWANDENAADVTVQSTLTDKAAGDLALSGLLTPTYTLSLRAGVYGWGYPNMGDVVPLIIAAGRLNVNTTIRVLGITYDIGDDGQEDVELTVGRPALTLPQLLAQPVKDTAALTRR